MGAERADAQAEDDAAGVYAVERGGSGPPLIMLGGGITGAAALGVHARALADQFAVVRLQTLNVARALDGKPLPPDYSIKMEARRIGRALAHLGLPQPIDIVAHSLGALIALDFALDRPHAVRSLVLSEPPAFWIVTAQERAADAAAWVMPTIVRQLTPAIEPTDAHLVAFLEGLGARHVEPPRRSDPARAAWDVRRRCLRGLSAVADHTDDAARLSRLRMAVLLVEGDETVVFHRRINAHLARWLPHAERLVLAGGHGAIHASAGMFLSALRAFLRRASGA